ncbi:class II aaRS and biotin synthetase [Massarina eburnea CBS 473.64]|uniref:Class II aaRS and biotin synthetase n=1 Tax=Massarina eburnea CBS 473.64 TaxID=1395130 RepID=A0A6A6RWX4_9PLEO|nr:class II aaRS and biotin synthetase [Massarina eburnea CBS 473.64]
MRHTSATPQPHCESRDFQMGPMNRTPLPFLRPYLYGGLSPRARPEVARAYNAVRTRTLAALSSESLGPLPVEKQIRIDTLRNHRPLASYHPRLEEVSSDSTAIPLRDFISKYERIQETQPELVDVFGQKLQVMLQEKNLPEQWRKENFVNVQKVMRRGDWVYFKGQPHRTKAGELSLLVKFPPQWLAPCLHHVPETVESVVTLARNPHVNQLTRKQPGDTLRLRAVIYAHIRKSLVRDGFLEVETPILDAKAGGAIARPFETVANDISKTTIRLRIAPELNLKRLIVGGQDRIFEIGRAFRNEGIDNTHNPEFSTCEFYEVGATLPELMERTEKLINGLNSAVELHRPTSYPSLTKLEDIDFTTPFKQLRFIPTIEKATGMEIPPLRTEKTLDQLIAMFGKLRIPLPTNPTLPRLLETLAEIYIEPLCTDAPTWITHHPEVLSPLAKSYSDVLSNGQVVAPRAELFIDGREYVNTYEEENSPFEQRKKFLAQLHHHPPESESDREIDESYLEVLEWGMPPTGGWGCGLDRLVMLFACRRRIADVLPFGSLRHVVSLSRNSLSSQ